MKERKIKKFCIFSTISMKWEDVPYLFCAQYICDLKQIQGDANLAI